LLADKVQIIFIQLGFLLAVTMLAFALRHRSYVSVRIDPFFLILVFVDNETFPDLKF
jgi:hypothetical protein